MVIIKTRELTKKFGSLVAVDNVNLEIEEGECFGLLGPNGAGKTSLIRMITAVSPPSSGSIWVLGSDLSSNAREVKAITGVVPQMDNLDPDLTVLQNLMTFARYFDIPRDQAYQRSKELLRLFHLEDKSNSRIRELSGGMRRRLLVARGLINLPRILILDEPTIGLDPQAKCLVWHKLIELKSPRVTRLLCTQNMEEASVLCDRVAIMHRGRIITIDSPARLISRHVGTVVWEIEPISEDKDKIANQLRTRGIDFEVVGNKIYAFHVDSDKSLRTLVGSAAKFRQRSATLEDVFFRLTGRSLTE